MDVPALSEESIGKLTQLLRKWRLEFLMSQFIDEKIDEEVLEMIDLSHINILLHKYPMGVQIRFAHHLDNWRKSIGKPLKAVTFDEFTTTVSPKESYGSSCGESRTSSQASTIAMVRNDSLSDITILSYNPSDNNDSDVASIRYASTENLSTTSVPKRQQATKPQSRAKVDLEEILLNSPPNGPDLIQLYRKQKHFTPLDRKRLISTIVNYYLECKITLDLATSYDLENAIVMMFPRESLQMYRNSRQGKIFMRYTREMAKEEESEKMRDEGCPDDNGNFGADISFELREDAEGGESMSHMDHDVLIQTVNEGQKKFIKIRAPFLYHSFLTTACEMFHITKVSDYCLYFTGCEIEEDRFKNLVMEFYKSPTFTLELVAKSKTVDTEVIANNLPDVNYIRNIPCLRPLVKIYDNDKPLENMHRTIIAKTIIDECLKFNPQRILKRPDFLTLADNICQAFHTEVQSTYFVPCHNAKPARGKLWSAYTNKRSLLKAAGLLSRRACRKRKLSLSSDENDDEQHPAKKFIIESPEFSANTHLDGDALAVRWQETHKCRRQELLEGEISAQDYMTKYSILQNIRGMNLVELDVYKMYPNRANMDNWLTLYVKVVERVRKVRKFKHVPKIIENIEASKDTRYRASLALNLLIYIFPHTGHYSKPEIQNRFLKEYKSMDDLMNDGQPGDLQIRFVNQSQKIVYADFTVCGCTFKFVDLLEALDHCFNYIMALNLEYPKLCLRLWQFVQLGIFHIDIERAKMPHVESTINDLLYVQKD